MDTKAVSSTMLFIILMYIVVPINAFKLFPAGPNALEQDTGETKTLRFKERLPDEVITVEAGEEVMLECEAGGQPVPTIHWLYQGSRIPQGRYPNVMNDEAYFEQTMRNQQMDRLQLGNTRGRFLIPCARPEDAGEYICVAQTPTERITSRTQIRVVGDDVNCASLSSGSPSHIYMWESQRLEFEGADVQLYCRAAGHPHPEVTWYDRNGDVIVSSQSQYKTLKNGDLLIKNIDWLQHMGLYTCRASNQYGQDEKQVFLYPTRP